jgi:hypothetical protein
MSFKNTIVGTLLSLVIGLSTTVSVVHNLNHHDRLSSNDQHDQHDHHKHFHSVDLNNHSQNIHHGHDTHNEHDESGCVFSVIQYTESLLIQLNEVISLPTPNLKKTAAYIGLHLIQSDNGFFARAPPF